MICGSMSAFIFATMRAGRPARAWSISRRGRAGLASRTATGGSRGLARRPSGARVVDFTAGALQHRLVHREGRLQDLAHLGDARGTRELQEQLVKILADRLVAAEKPVISVMARRLRVIVAGTEVAVATKPVVLAPHYHDQLGVRLEADRAK